MISRSSGTVKLIAVGDICPGDHYFSLGNGIHSRFSRGQLVNCLALVEPFINKADIALFNLEGPLSEISNRLDIVEQSAFRGAPQMAHMLAKAGFSHAHVANNHIMQHGEESFDQTIKSLIDAHLVPLGLRSNQGMYFCEPVFAKHCGVRLGMLGYSTVPDIYEPKQARYAQTESVEIIKKDIELLKSKADCVVVSLHTGVEAVNAPSPCQIHLFHELMDLGVDVVIGHHSHVVQQIEKRGNSIGIYSLGNFIFDLFWDRRFVEGIIANIKLDIRGSHSIFVQRVRFGSDYQVEPVGAEISKGELFSSPVVMKERQYEEFAAYYEHKNQLPKYIFFMRNFFLGSTKLKARFIFNKIKRLFR